MTTRTRTRILITTFFAGALAGMLAGCQIGECEYDPNGYAVCPGGATACICTNASDDEAGEEAKAPLWADGMMIVSHTSYDPIVAAALALSDEPPIDYDAPPCEAPEHVFRCFAELELIDDGDPSNDLYCGYCPSVSGLPTGDASTGPAMYICYNDPDDWTAGTLNAAVPSQWLGDGTPICETIDPPLGELDGYYLPLGCAETSCLGRNTGCSCVCRDKETGEEYGALYEAIEWWWSSSWVASILPSPLPPIVDYTLPVEVVCTGEPLRWVTTDGGEAYMLGTTAEFDGPDPAYPPNGEYQHTPAWDLLPGSPYLLRSLSLDFVQTVVKYPSEMQWGGGQIAGSTVTSCPRGSICDRLGLDVGDVLTDVEFADDVVAISLERDGEPVVLRYEVTP